MGKNWSEQKIFLAGGGDPCGCGLFLGSVKVEILWPLIPAMTELRGKQEWGSGHRRVLEEKVTELSALHRHSLHELGEEREALLRADAKITSLEAMARDTAAELKAMQQLQAYCGELQWRMRSSNSAEAELQTTCASLRDDVALLKRERDAAKSDAQVIKKTLEARTKELAEERSGNLASSGQQDASLATLLEDKSKFAAALLAANVMRFLEIVSRRLTFHSPMTLLVSARFCWFVSISAHLISFLYELCVDRPSPSC
jgi:hypothetical protein